MNNMKFKNHYGTVLWIKHSFDTIIKIGQTIVNHIFGGKNETKFYR